MYIGRMLFRNYGPITEINIVPKFDAVGNPIPLVIIGENGAGKTLLLSSLIDSFVEFKRMQFNEILETEKNKYFKIQKKNYIQTNKDYFFIDINFIDGRETANYKELVTNLGYSDFINKHNELSYFDLSQPLFQEAGFYKNCMPFANMKKSIEANVLLYFPFSRYEQPAWLSKDKAIGFNMSDNNYGESTRNIIKSNVIEDTQKWILDLVLDRELYEKNVISLPPNSTPYPNLSSAQLFLGYSGKNSTIIKLIEELLTVIYEKKYPDLEYARLGVSQKATRSISTMIKRKGQEEETVAPTLAHVSSGEGMLLGLFCSILKEYDVINSTPVTNLAAISGIVVIDEIDLHLHIEYKKTILPTLIEKFPQVQFVITTHSPLFLLGMEKISTRGVQLISLPIGNEVSVNEFCEFEKMYEIFVEKNMQYKSAYESIAEEIGKRGKALLVTEGKTDWRHLQSAIDRMCNEEALAELPIDIFKYEYDMGDPTLYNMCEQYAKLNRPNKIIFMFDRDNPNYIQKVNDGDSFRYWGNNVYSFCIPVPSNRGNYKNISIEFYYTDEDLKTLFEGKRLYFSNEIEIVVKKNPTTGETTTCCSALSEPRCEEEFLKKVYDQDVSKVLNSQHQQVALSKSVFAQNVYTGVEGFKNLDIREFKLIIDMIREIIMDNPS